MARAYLEISLKIREADRANAADVYARYKAPFLETVKGATSKALLVRPEDVQVLHGFETVADAQGYLSGKLFTEDVVTALKPYLQGEPDVRVYAVV